MVSPKTIRMTTTSGKMLEYEYHYDSYRTGKIIARTTRVIKEDFEQFYQDGGTLKLSKPKTPHVRSAGNVTSLNGTDIL